MKQILTIALCFIVFQGMGQKKIICDSCKMFELYHNAFMANDDYSKHDSLYYNCHVYFNGCMHGLFKEQKAIIKHMDRLINKK